MVSQGNPSNPTSSILHQFLVPIQNQFENQQHNFHAYGRSDMSPESIGVYTPTIHHYSLGDRLAVSRSMNYVQDPGHGVPAGHTHTHAQTHAQTQQHIMDLLGAPTPNEGNINSNNSSSSSSRLSLSLGPQGGFVPSMQQYRQGGLASEQLISASYLASTAGGGGGHGAGDYCFPGYGFASNSINHRSCSNSYTTEPPPPPPPSLTANGIGNSRYLRAAQSLLDEAANVGGRDIELNQVKRLFHGGRGGGRELLSSSELRAELLSFESSSLPLPAEKHQLQIKISKLIALLEQVENRYQDYCERMDELISSFQGIAGEGAANTYTALALQAMSRQFCSLRDAIVSQIKLTRRKLLPELPKAAGGLSQLSLFDREEAATQHNNNRLSLEQFGMIQSQKQVWRPIRGLPDTSVAILRAWLFEHFLHPYPNDSEKLILASQTGLTKNQVSNWFINARVRLWKPMIEEMYRDEFGDSSVDSDSLFSGSSATADHADECILSNG
ncbi:hypothetical protein Dimus_038677 [Dionaea muscipula]